MRVFARAHDHGAADDLAAVHVEHAAAKIAADFHPRDVLQIDRRAVALQQDDLFQVAGILDQPEAANDELHPVLLDRLAADVEIAARDGVHHHVQRDAERAHLLRIDFDLILPHEAADAGDFRDALHGVELVANEPILQRAQLAEIVAAVWEPRPDRHSR